MRIICTWGLLLPLTGCRVTWGETTVTLDARRTYQTLRGWSCNPHYLGGSKEQREQVIDEAVNSLGITRIRWQQPNGNRATMTRWELVNDNGDPEKTDLSRFNTADVDPYVKAYLLPFERRVKANGDPFELWLSPSFFRGGSTGDVPAFLLQSPGEYAEYATSFITYLRDKYGIATTHYAICNEAGNNNAFSPAVVAEFTQVLGERLHELGLPTKGQFSDGINAQVTWRYIDYARKHRPGIWKYVDVLSYHWYGAKNRQFMPKIRDFARRHDLDTAQTEYMHLTLDHLYDDLTLGGVSYWSIYGLGGPGPRGQNFWFRPDDTSFRRGRRFWTFRQVMHYVRPGAVRIEASTRSSAVRTLAFARAGRTTVVLLNTKAPRQARSVVVSGLPAGRYGVCRSVNGKPYRELGVKTVGADGKLTVTVPGGAVLTVYPHPGGNRPPIFTNWEAQPTFLKLPASRVRLLAAAQDPELDPLAYSWSVSKHPPGAGVTLSSPHAAETEATGLTASGRYGFTIVVSDGTNQVERTVWLNVFRGNQPPRLIDVHNRIPVVVTLPQNQTLLRGGAFDLEGDRLTYHWTVVKQPRGSKVKVEPGKKGGWRLTNITKPGKHVLRFTADDGHHAVSQELTIPVFPENHAPMITSLTATPAKLVSPAGVTTLAAATNDPDGDVITHWWRVVNHPAGTRPVFVSRSARRTVVSGLKAAGRYTFELTVVDRTKFTRKRVTVVVAPRDVASGTG